MNSAELRSVSPGRLWVVALLYTTFVVYGSLIPFDFRDRSLANAVAAFEAIPYLELGVASRADWVANILLYIPLSFLWLAVVAGRARRVPWFGGIAVAIACVALAFGIEFAQLYFPPRTVSQNDLIAETIGTAIGIALWITAGYRLLALWQGLRTGGEVAHRALLALFVLGYLALSFFPYDLLVSTSELRNKLANPAVVTWGVAGSCGGALTCSVKLGTELLAAVPIGALLALVFPSMRVPTALLVGFAIGAVIEGGQILLASGVSQGVSLLTRALGVAWGLALQHTLRLELLERHSRAVRLAIYALAPVYVATLLGLNGFAGFLEPGWMAAEKLAATRFMPFYYHYFTTETAAMWSLLANAAAYAPAGVATWLLRPRASRVGLSAVLGAMLALMVETAKLFIQGAKPDPTNVMIGAAGAALVHAALARLVARTGPIASRQAGPRHPDKASDSDSKQSLTSSSGKRGRDKPERLLWAGAATTAAVIGIGALLATPHAESPADESKLPQLAPGDVLPPVELPHFQHRHPRLPHPSGDDILRLRREGGEYLGEMQRLIKGASADSYSYQARSVLEFIDPGSQDLATLHAQLMSTQFEWRGHDQVRPLAVAYDWLYDRWSPSQRELLRAKLADGCEYLVQVIRTERMSPYNVYLYNAPFQALVACSIALWGDDTRGEPVMRFTADLWKNRVLPVWRQVMGKNGGWHEGGEYVGIGIGSAIWEVPAMWRSATGEDFFASEPGIRGFLDFLIQRTRPDGTHLRIGDGSFFDRNVPASIPLAIEYRNSAAYSMAPPKATAPTAWPWGPLPQPWLDDPAALSRQPLSKLFDGIGWVISRSDWSPQATMVSFKAGDNYWSHSHLDQGSFTIYKGGALALDSGANYGSGYGSDHHLNYSYQTIAHNAITITDPNDTVPIPAKPQERPRSIANEGGQRRIGSGWGIEPAPLDLAEWQSKYSIYHAGRIVRFEDKDGITLAVADVTPAYTNDLSGRGTFSHRTRRVERAWRVFAYDRVDDVVIVYDDVIATKPEFRKRWLLHTTNLPQVDGRNFVAESAPRPGPGRTGGRLEGRVLLPKVATLLPVGGHGFEFFVDDINYDEGGKIQPAVEQPPERNEPGRWRLELLPQVDKAADRFLVVLLPRALGEPAPHHTRLLEDGGRTGAEVAGPRRTVRYWFREGELNAQVEVLPPVAK